MRPCLIFVLCVTLNIKNDVVHSLRDAKTHLSKSEAEKRCNHNNSTLLNYKQFIDKIVSSVYELRDGESAWISGYAKFSSPVVYRGCYRPINGNFNFDQIGSNDIYSCVEYCLDNTKFNFKVEAFGITRNTCVCFNKIELNRLSPVDDSLCNNKCSVVDIDTCGGKQLFSIYILYKNETLIWAKNGGSKGQCFYVRRKDNGKRLKIFTASCFSLDQSVKVSGYICQKRAHRQLDSSCEKNATNEGYCLVNSSFTRQAAREGCSNRHGVLADLNNESQILELMQKKTYYWLGVHRAYVVSETRTRYSDACLAVTRQNGTLHLDPDSCDKKKLFLCEDSSNTVPKSTKATKRDNSAQFTSTSISRLAALLNATTGNTLVPMMTTVRRSISRTHQQVSNKQQNTHATHQQVPNQQDTPATHQQVPNRQKNTPATHQQAPNRQKNTPATHQQVPSGQKNTPATHQQAPNQQDELWLSFLPKTSTFSIGYLNTLQAAISAHSKTAAFDPYKDVSEEPFLYGSRNTALLTSKQPLLNLNTAANAHDSAVNNPLYPSDKGTDNGLGEPTDKEIKDTTEANQYSSTDNDKDELKSDSSGSLNTSMTSVILFAAAAAVFVAAVALVTVVVLKKRSNRASKTPVKPPDAETNAYCITGTDSILSTSIQTYMHKQHKGSPSTQAEVHDEPVTVVKLTSLQTSKGAGKDEYDMTNLFCQNVSVPSKTHRQDEQLHVYDHVVHFPRK